MNGTKNLFVGQFSQDTWLMGDCFDEDTKTWKTSSLRLDGCLGDQGGEFFWGGNEFTEKATDIRFDPHEGAADQPILRAKLQDDAGFYHEKDKNLSERIKNIHGRFEFH